MIGLTSFGGSFILLVHSCQSGLRMNHSYDCWLPFSRCLYPENYSWKVAGKPRGTPRKIGYPIQDQNLLLSLPYLGHLVAPTRSHLIGEHPSGLTKEQTTETMDQVPKTKGLQPYPPWMKSYETTIISRYSAHICSEFDMMFKLCINWNLGCIPFGVIWIRISKPRSTWIMVHQRNQWIRDQSGFIASFDAPWSRQILDHWSWYRSPLNPKMHL